jgi:hypothetical protein
MLALCYRHMSHNNGSWTIEAMKHKSTAQHLLQCAMQADNHDERRRGFELGILDTILILFTLDVSDLTLISSGRNSDEHGCVVRMLCIWGLDYPFNACSSSPRSLRRSDFPTNT